MDLSCDQLANTLGKVFGFHRLEKAQINLLLEDAELVYFPSDKMIYVEGARAESFYIVYEGLIEILKEKKQALIYKNAIKPLFSFGEDVFSDHHQRRTSARAAGDTILIKFSKKVISAIADDNPIFQRDMQRQAASYHYLLQTRMGEMEDETVCFISQPHPITVLFKIAVILLAVLAAGILSFFLREQGLFPIRTFPWMVGLLAAGCMVWLVWVYFEWANDFYYLTDKRINNTRRSHLVLEERQETPLSAIESIQARKNVIGRALQFGDLVINTYTGSTRIPNVPDVEEVQELLQFMASRRRAASEYETLEDFRAEMQQRISRTVPGQSSSVLPTERAGGVGRGSELQQPADEHGQNANVILLRKHFTVLLAKIFMPGLLLLCLCFFYLFLRFNDFPITTSAVFNWVALILCVILIMWLAYRAMDWNNDRFVISEEMLIDIDRRPFGMEEKRAAPIERIQSIRYKKKGFFGLLFNFGTVFIRIGDEEFTFDDLHRPADVTEMIFDAKESLLEKGRTRNEERDRKRALDWIETYHHLQTQEKNKNGENDPIEP